MSSIHSSKMNTSRIQSILKIIIMVLIFNAIPSVTMEKIPISRVVRDVTNQVTIEVVTYTSSDVRQLRWDNTNKLLFYVDTIEKGIYNYDPATKESRVLDASQLCSGITDHYSYMNSSNGYIVQCRKELVEVIYDFKKTHESAEDINADIINYVARRKEPRVTTAGAVDWNGKLYIATAGQNDDEIASDQGILYRWDEDEGFKNVWSDFTTMTSMTWCYEPMTLLLCYSEGERGDVECLTYDSRNEEFNRDIQIMKSANDDITGMPVGVTCDKQGNLWFGVQGEGRVVRVDVESTEILDSFNVPYPYITDIAFGGEGLETLYVGCVDDKDETSEGGIVLAVTGHGGVGRADRTVAEM